jgi:ribose 5-phosphate isomerase B
VRIVVGSDHGGYALKHEVVAGLRRDGHDVLDVGTDSPETRGLPGLRTACAASCQGHRDRAALHQGTALNGESLCTPHLIPLWS